MALVDNLSGVVNLKMNFTKGILVVYFCHIDIN
jgi:hypothetical protein